jgi:hypothetical protein
VDGEVFELTMDGDRQGLQMYGDAAWVGGDGDELTVIGNAVDAAGPGRAVQWQCTVSA